jgi:hypothetical protein
MPNREQIHLQATKMLLPHSTGAVAATLTTALTGANNDIVLTAITRGLNGNGYSLTLVDPGGNSQALAVTLTANDISASLATGVAGAITTTAAQLLAAIAASAAGGIVMGALATGNDGTGIVTALTKTALTGGALAGTAYTASLDTQGYDAAYFTLFAGSLFNAPTSVTVQESSDNVTFTDAATGAVIGQGDIANWAASTAVRLAYVGSLRYTRIKIVIANPISFSVAGVLGEASVNSPANPF